MSSSVFSESPISTNESRMGDSNLVVVYGKNGINNVDREGLENLIDDKGVSTISVVRLTSPTPSMKEETQNEMDQNRQIENDDSFDEKKKCDEEYACLIKNDETNSENELEEKFCDKYKTSNNSSIISCEKPESVGLILEDFCLPEKTKEITKAALTLSGVRPLFVSVDFEIQKKALKNDHCYTPLVSPSQLHEKKTEVKPVSSSIISAATLAKAAQKMAAIKAKNAAIRAAAKYEKCKEDIVMKSSTNCDSENNETIEEEIESEYSGSNKSADTDNDRDSDLDFNVHDRMGRRRRSNKKGFKRKSKNKKRISINSDLNSSFDEEKKVTVTTKIIRNSIDKTPTIQILPQPTNVFSPTIHKTTALNYKPVHTSAKVLITNNKTETKSNSDLNLARNIKPTTKHLQTFQSDVLSNIITGTGKPSGDPSGKPVVQNVVIIKPPNKKSYNVSGGFTDITKYLTKPDNLKTSNVQVCELIKPDNSGTLILRKTKQEMSTTHNMNNQKLSSPSNLIKRTGFMPLISDKVKSVELSSHISREKIAESTEEIDIIDSLVGQIQNSEENRLNASVKTVKLFEQQNANQNAFTSSKLSKKNSITDTTNTTHPSFTTTTNQVDSVDISNAPLLETVDEIPEDLIKDMADLIDHKTLQELVEEQEQYQNQHLKQSVPVDFETNIPKNFLIQTISHSENQNISQTNHKLIKKQEFSDIQQSIGSRNFNQSDFEENILNQKSEDNISKENDTQSVKHPIQVVSRSGRVITLPPIEAPTTRAKRRAAACVLITDIPTTPISSSVSEASESELSNISKVLTPNSKSLQKNIQKSVPKETHKDSTSDNFKIQKQFSTVLLDNEERNQTINKSIIDKEVKYDVVDNNDEDYNNEEDDDGDEDEDEDDDGDEDEDDPNKLWCICRQPHNNRFMICCDSCEDWFHGTCVGVTKTMGKEMEINKTEWTCPNCRDGKKQQTIKKMFEKQFDEIKNLSNEITISIEDNKEKTQDSIKKAKKRKSENESLSGVPKPLSKKMQQKISEIIGVPLPETTSLPTVENFQEMSTNMLVQKKKLIVNNNLETTTNIKTKLQNIVTLATKDKESYNLKENEQLSIEISNDQNSKELITKSSEQEVILCIVCKKGQAKPNSIYCSDDCIRKHAYNALNYKATKNQITSCSNSQLIGSDSTDKKKKQPSSFEEALENASLLTPKKIERVCVFERKTGKILTGNNAPTTSSLKRWLQENPTFEVVQPGSPQAEAIEKNKYKQKVQMISIPTETQRAVQSYHHRHQTSRSQSQQKNVIKIIKSISSNPSPKLDDSFLEDVNESIIKPLSQKLMSSKGENIALKFENKVEGFEIKPEKSDKSKPEKFERNDKLEKQKTEKSPVKANVKKQLSKEKERDKDLDKDKTQSSEPIRLNVKKTLKEKLLTRLGEITEENYPKLSASECEHFANQTEEEMFEFFHRDTGVKYKAKYRSLAFNIKDHKNKTLIRKICEKIIEPKQLVRMTPEELASQELAQWRENENKHQLEMIKKSELDLLSCAKNYVLKTHKGEEVIEDKHTDRVNLDITIPVEDVVAVLNNSTVSSSSEIEKTFISRDQFKTAAISQDYDIDSSLGSNVTKMESPLSELNISEIDENKRKEIKKDKEKRRDRHYRNKDRHREKAYKRSRSRSKSKDRKYYITLQKSEGNRSHNNKRSQSYDNIDTEIKGKNVSNTYGELDKSHNHHHRHSNIVQQEQEDDLHGFVDHEKNFKHQLNKGENDETLNKDKKEIRKETTKRESSKEKEQREKRDKYPYLSQHHENKYRSYAHSPRIDEDEDEKKKRRHHSSHYSQSHHYYHQHHRSSSQISGSSPSIDSEESRKDISTKSKIENKSIIPTSTTITICSSEMSANLGKTSSIGSNKQNLSSHKTHKNKSSNQKSKTKVSEYSLIDKIFAESEKTIEEAANLVPSFAGKEKSSITPADSQSCLSKSFSVDSVNLLIESKDSRKIDSFGNDSEQELPSSTVTIPTPPEDPYVHYASDISTIIWTGNINMIDVATFNIVIQPISGNHTNIEKEFPMELDVVGRIGPDTVWDYIGKIKKSPNKEIVLVRLVPSPESETNAYTALYLYLEKRKRLGVVKTTSSGIKDFYVLPLHSKTELPSILQTASNIEFFDDDSRPDLLIGILIRIMDFGHIKRQNSLNLSLSTHSDPITKIVKKPITSLASSSVILRGETVIQNKKIAVEETTALLEDDNYKPESPHMNKNSEKTFSIVEVKEKMKQLKGLKVGNISNRETYIGDDADEPYSPGGSSDDDINNLNIVKTDVTSLGLITNTTTMSTSNDELQRKVEELTRQIEKEKKEIETLGTVATSVELAPALANISIPSNLQQILASIQKPDTSGIDFKSFTTTAGATILKSSSNSNSRLASLSEAELLKMVPDNIDLTDSNSNSKFSSDYQNIPPLSKKSRWDIDPPPPGLEDEYE